MVKKQKQKFLLIETFFVISQEEFQDWLYKTRRNVLELVHYGFSREELYYMPVCEFMDYIKLLNSKAEDGNQEVPEIDEEKRAALQNVKMAGTIL